MNQSYIAILLFLTIHFTVHAQFLENFEADEASVGKEVSGWNWFTGDGEATMTFIQEKGFATIVVDGTNDRRNIWWALVKKEVTDAIDVSLLSKPGYGLRIEARVRPHVAPRRINLYMHTSRPSNHDNHDNLMEYDLPKANEWKVVSLTSAGMDVQPRDKIFAQLSLMDWGNEVYKIDIDYFKVDVVAMKETQADLGEPIPYWPPLADPAGFSHSLKVSDDAIIHLKYPEVNMNTWQDATNNENIITVNDQQWILLKFDFSQVKGKRMADAGQLALFTYNVQKSTSDIEEFNKIRITEIIDGADWQEETVNLEKLLNNQPVSQVINSQMIVDAEVNTQKGSATMVTISRPVMQRLMDGTSKGIAITTLGGINASFYSHEANEKMAAELRFNLE